MTVLKIWWAGRPVGETNQPPPSPHISKRKWTYIHVGHLRRRERGQQHIVNKQQYTSTFFITCGYNKHKDSTHGRKKKRRGRPKSGWRREGDSWIQMAKLEPTKKERNNKKEIGCKQPMFYVGFKNNKV